MKPSNEISSIMKVSQPFFCNRKQKINQDFQVSRWMVGPPGGPPRGPLESKENKITNL